MTVPIVVRSVLIVNILLAATECTFNCPKGWKSYINSNSKVVKCYREGKEQVDFFTAIDRCRSVNSQVVSINSHAENMLLQHLFYDHHSDEDDASRHVPDDEHFHTHHGDKFIWISAMRSLPENSDHSFRWIYGQRLNYSNWDMKEPSDVKENCAVITSNGFWSSVYCYTKHSYVCEIEPGLEEKMKQQRLVIFNRELIEITNERDALSEDLDSQLKRIFILTGLSGVTLLVIAGQIYSGSFRWRKQLRNPTNVKNEQENTYNNNFPSLNFEQ